MSGQRFVVVEYTPGYLPEDDDPATFDNITDARVYASDLLSRLLDHLYESHGLHEDAGGLPFSVEGSFASGLSVIVYDKTRMHDLGRTIEILNDESEVDVWTFTEDAPAYVSATADLWHWSTNYDAGRGPITLMLDLIGWSDDNIGEPLYSLKDASLGYLELAKLAAALSEYADRPQDVREWIDQLCSLEGS